MLTRTTTAILDQLADPTNEAIWHEFDARYRPVLVAFARRLGLDAEDAADAAQDALARFVGSYRSGKYERGRGRLGSWLIGIARNCIVDLQRRRAARPERHGLSDAADPAEDGRHASIWDSECEREILRQALRSLEDTTNTDERTLRAFELLAFRDMAPVDVARELDMTANDVYLAKHRCLKRLRPIVDGLRAAFEDDA